MPIPAAPSFGSHGLPYACAVNSGTPDVNPRATAWSNARPSRALLVVAAVAASVFVGLAIAAFEGDPGISDTAIYEGYGERVAGGQLPFRDFSFEYPPGALAPFVAPALLTSQRDSFDAVFVALMIAMLAVVSAFVALILRALDASNPQIVGSVCALLIGVAILGPFVFTRFDLFAAVITLAAIAAIVQGRDRLGAIILGIAIATKIYPIVLVPLLVTRSWRRGGRSEGLTCLGLVVASTAAVYLPFVVFAPTAVARGAWSQLGRPLQIESLGSGVLLAMHHLADVPLGWESSAGSQNLTGTIADATSIATTMLGIAALVYVSVRFARGDTQSTARFVQFAAAALVAFVAFGKVASPQFLVWLLGVVVLVVGHRGVLSIAVVLIACGLTRLWFPGSYWDLVEHFDPFASWLVLARSCILVGALACLLALDDLSGARAPRP